MDQLERFLLIASSDNVTRAIDFALLDAVALGERTHVSSGHPRGCVGARLGPRAGGL